MSIRTELWVGHKIRFVEKDGEWWAVAKDVAEALGYRDAYNMTRLIDSENKGTHKVSITSNKVKCPDTQGMLIISEFGIYDAVFNSHKPEANEFKKWVFNIIKTLRQSIGLEGFQVFRILDKNHQKETMSKLNEALKKPVRVNFIKANTIANKAVSMQHGYSKMVKKEEMTPEMLVDRQPILEDTVNLMGLVDKYNLNLSVSQSIYNGLTNKQTG
jgi:prophage antirepressor-like protein